MKYIIHPGIERSKSDGTLHYITASQLIRLYGVNLKDCIISRENQGRKETYPDKCQHLYPQYDGNYSI